MGIIELVTRARQGDEAAYLELFGLYEEDLYRVAYVYLGSPEDALDAVQETAYRSFKSIKSLKEPQYFKTWLIKIAMSCSTDMLRKRNKQTPWKPEMYETIAAFDDGDPALSLTLQELVETLDFMEKQVIVLRYYYDCTIRETAEIMDIPLGTSKTLLYRALKKLRHQAEEGEYGFR